MYVVASQPKPPRYCACGTRLARDNRSKRCTACQKAAGRQVVAPPAVPASFWQSPELVEALEAWHIGHVIRAYRLHEHWPEPIAQVVVANWVDLTQAQLSRIETGAAVTDLAKLIPMVQTLGIPADLLWFKLPKDRASRPASSEHSGDYTNMSVTEPEAINADNADHAPGPLPPDTSEEDDVRRRRVLQGILAGAGTALTASTISSLTRLEQVRQDLDRLLENSAVGGSTLDRWESLPGEYGQRYQMVPPGQLLEDVAGDLVELQYLLGLKQTTKSRIRLFRVSSQLATLAGIFLAAQGDKRGAQNWFHTAGVAASEADDAQLAGLALVRSGIVSLYHGAPGRALTKLAKAQSLLGATPTPWRARALVVEIRSLAKLGKRNEAVSRLAAAETTFEDMPASALSDPALGYTERQFYFTVGNAYTHLGMLVEADAMQRQALGMYQPTEYLDPALIQLDQAQCLVSQGDVDSACQQAVATISAVPNEHQGLVTHYGRNFFAELPSGAKAATAGRELRELLAVQGAIT